MKNEEKIINEAIELLSPELKFVSYDGKYPNLCAGELVLSFGSTIYVFERHSLSSGGSATFDREWRDHVSSGEWNISEWPKDFPEDLKNQAIELVNENVRQGCCGGCL